MTTTDLVQKTINAIVTIVNADSGVRTLTGRTTKNIRPISGYDFTALPIVLWYLIGAIEEGAPYDTRRVSIGFKGVAEGTGAIEKANNLLERLELGITWTTLNGQGLDATPLRRTRFGITQEERQQSAGARGLVEADLEIELMVTA